MPTPSPEPFHASSVSEEASTRRIKMLWTARARYSSALLHTLRTRTNQRLSPELQSNSWNRGQLWTYDLLLMFFSTSEPNKAMLESFQSYSLALRNPKTRVACSNSHLTSSKLLRAVGYMTTKIVCKISVRSVVRDNITRYHILILNYNFTWHANWVQNCQSNVVLSEHNKLKKPVISNTIAEKKLLYIYV